MSNKIYPIGIQNFEPAVISISIKPNLSTGLLKPAATIS